MTDQRYFEMVGVGCPFKELSWEGKENKKMSAGRDCKLRSIFFFFFPVPHGMSKFLGWGDRPSATTLMRARTITTPDP